MSGFSLPLGIAITPGGDYAYVANSGGNNVLVIQTSSNTTTAAISVGTNPKGVAITPNGNYAYVTDYSGASGNRVTVIDTSTGTVAATISGLNGPFGVAITPDGNYAYVANYVGNTVSVIQTSTEAVTATINVGTQPQAVAITPNGNFVYVVNYNGNSVSVINTSTNTVSATVNVGSQPQGVAITPDGNYAYVSNSSSTLSNSVSVINTSTNTVTATIPVGSNPIGVAITPDGNYAYVANYLSNSVKVIDTSTNTVAATITVGTQPNGVAITPDGNTAYVTNTNGNTVSVLGKTTWTITPEAGANGSISPATVQTTNDGSSTTFTFTPNAHYHVSQVLVDGTNVGTPAAYTFSNVSANHTIEADFVINTWTVTPNAIGYGTVSPGTAVITDEGSTTTFTFNPNPHSHVTNVRVDGTSVGTPSSYSFTNVSANHTIEAEFERITWMITPEAGANGSISPATVQTTNEGSDTTFTFTPDANYHVSQVLVDGANVGTPTAYTFSNVSANHTIEADFIALSPAAPSNFNPVPASTTQMNYTWTDNSSNESGFVILDGSNNVKVLVAANATSTSETGLLANTQYTRKVTAYNGGGAATSDAVSKYTSIEAAVRGTYEAGTTTSITIHSSNAPSNLTSESSGIYFENVTQGTNSGWIQNNTWTSSGLPSNTTYSFKITARNGDGTITSTTDAGCQTTNNLLTNPGGESADTTGWTVIDNGGSGWLVGGGFVHSGNYSFQSSYSWCSMNQTIDLLSKGYSAAQLDAQPVITFKDWVMCRDYFDTYYYMKFDLLAADGVTVISSESIGSQASPVTLPQNTAWTEVSRTFTGYGTGVRYIKFKHAGYDGGRWAGQYGTYFDDASVTVAGSTYYLITSEAGSHGSITPSGTASVYYCDSQQYVITPSTGYHVSGLLIDGGTVTATTEYTFTSVAADHTIIASFEINSYLITSEAGSHGTITPSGETSVNYGSDQQYLITPEAGYSISDVLVDAVSQGKISSYTFTNVTANHSIEASFSSSAISVHTPEAAAFSNVTTTVIKANWKANGNPVSAEYYCENVTTSTNSGWISGLTWTSSSLEASTVYSFRVKARITATSESGWVLLGTQETTAQATADASIAGVSLKDGDSISSTLTITVSLTSETTISSLSIKPQATLGGVKEVDVDGASVAYDVISTTSTSATIRLRNALSVGTHTIKIITYDTAGTEYVLERTNLKVSSGTITTVGPTLVYPNPYDPLAGNLKITYYLSVDTGTTIYVFDTTGRLGWKSDYPSGTNGGKAGYNEVLWNAVDMFGSPLASDTYFINIIEQGTGRAITKVKLVVWKGGVR
ncbi:MAG: hypothetical protein NTZ10_01555 [Candidatus Saganbacteria bacterium]|nr:hypothetical protein [Candidatus Saganbacteria bacterium]